MKYESELKVAVEAVRLASSLCQAVRAALITEDTLAKHDASPVTVADFGAQAVISELLMKAFPGDPLVGEEDASHLRGDEPAALRSKVVQHVQAVMPEMAESGILSAIDRGTFAGGARGRHWTLDPIDGTKGFLRGEQYAVALALIEDGQVVLGVLGCPNLPLDGAQPNGAAGCLFMAHRGAGATAQALSGGGARPIRVMPSADPATTCFCESVESGHTSHSRAARVAELLGVRAAPLRMDSQAKYAAVARGDAAAYLRLPTKAGYEEKIWDHAAGCLVVTEAGGQVTDIHGKPLDFSIGRTLRANQGVVATNGRFHDRVIAAVGRVLSSGTTG